MATTAFLLQHLPAVEVPPDHAEVACSACMQACDFLHAYKLNTVQTKLEKKEVPGTKEDIVVVEKSDNSCSKAEGITSVDIKPESGTGTEPSVGCELARRYKTLAATSSSAASDIDGEKRQEEGACFFVEDWRKLICKCPLCMVRCQSGLNVIDIHIMI